MWQAIQIFEAKADREVRDTLAADIATQFGITAKAVRDIWNLRTWNKTTMPFWTQADHDRFLNKRLCQQCRSRKIRSLPDGCETCSKPRARGRPRIQRIKLWLDTAAKVPQKDVLQVSQKVEEKLEQAEAGAGATLSEGHSKISIDECCYVRPDPKVCVAVQDVLDGMYLAHTSEVHEGTGCSIGAPLFFSTLDDDEGEVTQLTCEETPATMFSRQGNASACGDSDFLQSTKIDAEECHEEEDAEECHEEEGASWETCAEMLSRQGTVLARDMGDLILQSDDHEDDAMAFCGTAGDEGVVGATYQTLREFPSLRELPELSESLRELPSLIRQTRKLSHHQALPACDDGEGVLLYNEEQEIVL